MTEQTINQIPVEPVFSGVLWAKMYLLQCYIGNIPDTDGGFLVSEFGDVTRFFQHPVYFLPGVNEVVKHVSKAGQDLHVLDYGGCIGAMAMRLAALGNVSQSVSYDPNPHFESTTERAESTYEDAQGYCRYRLKSMPVVMDIAPSIAEKVRLISDLGKIGREKMDVVTMVGICGSLDRPETVISDHLECANKLIKMHGRLIISHEHSASGVSIVHDDKYLWSLADQHSFLEDAGFEVVSVIDVENSFSVQKGKAQTGQFSKFPWALIQAKKVRGL